MSRVVLKFLLASITLRGTTLQATLVNAFQDDKANGKRWACFHVERARCFQKVLEGLIEYVFMFQIYE